MAVFTVQKHKYSCAPNALLLHNENTHALASVPGQLRKCSGAVSKCSRADYNSCEALISLLPSQLYVFLNTCKSVVALINVPEQLVRATE